MREGADEKEVLVSQVDESQHSNNKGRRSTNNSVNMGHNDEAIDHFLDEEGKDSHIDTEIRNHMKSSRFSYLAGDHGFTVN